MIKEGFYTVRYKETGNVTIAHIEKDRRTIFVLEEVNMEDFLSRYEVVYGPYPPPKAGWKTLSIFLDYTKFMTIVQHPDPVLLTPTEEVSDFSSIPALSKQMFEAMRKFRGIGLAANQIGCKKRVAVMQVPGWPEMTLVNPKIVKSKGEGTLSEGCLSVKSSGLRVPVKRAKIVWVEYQDEFGVPQKRKASDLLARCIQHELDHLDGLTCLERTNSI